MSVLWEGGRHDPEHVRACKDNTQIAEGILEEISGLSDDLRQLGDMLQKLRQEEIVDSADSSMD
ncbi:hypothetical protein HGRIS_009788 [Hohenbuehelia grisea]|uniref:Uncharacterized protein n=1 Tax=Hohenbuehelia grisea TaxID=104357 RepID=A0ABR3J3N7_9AGAR